MAEQVGGEDGPGPRRLTDALLHGCVQGGVAGRRLRAAAGHVVAYWTWRSLVVEQELGDAEAVEIGVALLSVVTRG